MALTNAGAQPTIALSVKFGITTQLRLVDRAASSGGLREDNYPASGLRGGGWSGGWLRRAVEAIPEPLCGNAASGRCV